MAKTIGQRVATLDELATTMIVQFAKAKMTTAVL